MRLKDCFVDRMLAKWDDNDRKRFACAKYPEDVAELLDVPYIDDGERGHLLDIRKAFKANGTSELRPVLIDMHGGGFMTGSKELDRLFCCYMAKNGFLTFGVNYRLAGRGIYVYDQIFDAAMAVQWVMEHLHEYNGDASRVYLCGHSAGAVLAVMAALVCTNARLGEVYEIPFSERYSFNGMVLDCGLMSFYRKSISYLGMRSMVFPKGYAKTARYRNMLWESIPELASLPKTYLISNEKDELCDMTREYKAILDKSGVRNKLNFSGDDGHMGVIYSPNTPVNERIIRDMIEWLGVFRYV